MDEIVKQAMAKWPKVPHCYGWLALDARGTWRMRDERAQALGLPGDKILHPALQGFINRNYTHDARGCWYFQNGPQRVYVNLEATPYIARTDRQHGFVLHTGQSLPAIEAAWLTVEGDLIVQGAGKVAQVDDRDLAWCMPRLQFGTQPAADEQLLAWLAGDGAAVAAAPLHLIGGERPVPVGRVARAALGARFGFVHAPQPDTP